MTTTELWGTYSEDIKRFIYSKVKDSQLADDLLQETFVKVHTKLSSVTDSQKIKSWLFSIARNVVYDYFRKSNIQVPFADTEIEETEETYIHTEKDCLFGIIKNLPKKYRDPLFLSDIKGIKQGEIANQLKRPLATVKSQVQRARKMIAKGYMECCDYKLNEKGHLVGEVKDKEHCKMCSSLTTFL